MKTAESFFNWAFRTRANNVIKLASGEEMSPEKVFLSFCSHDPALVSYGPAGLNASIKGVGFMPKPEYLEETLAAYIEHIKSWTPDDKTYSERGLKLLIKYMYGEEARHRIDFTCIGSLEMAKKHSYANYKANPEATIIYYQPPAISYELRGKMEIHDEMDTGKREIYQQFLNAQHDVYHRPDMTRWLKYPAYVFRIEEIYDNCVTKEGFGTKMIFPY
ncbi:MAG: hypothetical protein RBQ64_00025 [Candidatus Izemoplasmatales bacterium]|jgi:hypothetical protein|nr:hypothetical protein [Candidatus Izemoplasmatales bacterium]